MTPAHIKEILKRMWGNNTDVLSLIYAIESKQVPHSSKIHTKYEDLYEMFFIQTVPVAPCKFRNPSKLGDQVFEHPQNTLLTAIINSNIDLVSISQSRDQNRASAEPGNENQVCSCSLVMPQAPHVYISCFISPGLLGLQSPFCLMRLHATADTGHAEVMLSSC